MSTFRKVAALAAGSLMVASLSGCSDSSEKGGVSKSYSSSFSLTMVTPSVPSDPYWGSVKAGATQAAKDFNVDFTYLAPTVASDAQTQETQLLKAAISKRPRALVVGDAFPTSLDPLIKQAVGDGATAVIMNSGQDSVAKVGAVGFVGQNDFEAGVAAGKEMVAAGATHVLVPTVPGLPVSDQRVGGFVKGFSGPGHTVTQVAIPLAQVTDATAVQRAIQGSLSSHKGVDALMAIGIVIWTPATAALKQAGLTQKIKLATFDISTNALQALKGGETEFLIDQQPYLQGYYAVQMAAQRIRYGVLPAGAVLATGPNILKQSDAEVVLTFNRAGVRGAS